MRRDLAYFYPVPVQAVYNAYSQSAMQKFGKDCKHNPPLSLSFGLNYSFKYNMNGGSCTIHFMPYQNGTAINIRYTIIQAFGARYGSHAQELNSFAASILRVNPQPINLDVSIFINYAASQGAGQQFQGNPNGYAQYPQNTQPVAQYPQQNAQQVPQNAQQVSQNANPVNAAPAQGSNRFCVRCGSPLSADARFCVRCGTPVQQPTAQAAVICPNCSRALKPDESFCVQCGTKRPQ